MVERATWLLVLVCLAGCGLRPSTRPVSDSPMTQLTRLDNGLTVAIQEDRSVPLVTMDMWVRVGSGDEPAHLAGISHFLEHMLFKGTPSLAVGEYDRRVEFAGGYLNAATSMDYTHYYVTLPAKEFSAILPLFADVIQNSSIDPDEVASERQVILEEIRRKNDSPFGYLFDEAFPSRFASGPYSHPVIGSSETVTAMTRDQLHEHYQRFYAPENMHLSIVGDVPKDATLVAIQQSFGALRRPLRPWRDAAPAPVWSPPAARHLPREWKEAYVLLAFESKSPATLEEVVAADMAEALLVSGRSSRLTKVLVEEKQLASSVGAYFPTSRHDAPMLIYATCAEQNIDAVRAEITAQLAQISREGFSAAELRRIQRQSINGHLFGTETNSGRASSMAYSLVMRGDLSLHDGYAEAVRGVSEREVLAYMRKNLRPETASVTTTK